MEIGRGHLGWPVEHSEGKGGESVVAILRFLCGSSHLCRLRTEWLVSVSKYWTYRSHAGDVGPVSLVACHQQVFGLSALLQWLCWERNWGRSRGLLNRAKGWSREHFFLGAVHPFNPVDDLVKGWCIWTTWNAYGRGSYADRAWKACDVLIGFSPAGCTLIRIVATLEYE
jgi:hypothetical protein